MATYDDLVSRIADDLNRSDINTQIGVAINRAIRHYSSEAFWFNEGSGSFTTVSGTQTYTTASASPIPSYIREIAQIRLYDGSGSYATLRRRSIQWLLETNVSGTTTTGEPTDYAWWDETLYLYPTPDAAYSMTMYYTKGYADLTTGESNDFTNNAEDLIESRASWWVLSRVVRDQNGALVAKQEEMDALSRVRGESQALLGTGRLTRCYL